MRVRVSGGTRLYLRNKIGTVQAIEFITNTNLLTNTAYTVKIGVIFDKHIEGHALIAGSGSTDAHWFYVESLSPVSLITKERKQLLNDLIDKFKAIGTHEK